MNKLVVITALALLAASPAFAKSRHHVTSPQAVGTASHAADAFRNAYGSISDPAAVMQGSRMVGRDPDAGIRTRILLQSQTSYFSK